MWFEYRRLWSNLSDTLFEHCAVLPPCAERFDRTEHLAEGDRRKSAWISFTEVLFPVLRLTRSMIYAPKWRRRDVGESVGDSSEIGQTTDDVTLETGWMGPIACLFGRRIIFSDFRVGLCLPAPDRSITICQEYGSPSAGKGVEGRRVSYFW